MKLLAILAAHAGLAFGQSMTPPELVKQVEPEYPVEARAKRIEGVVTVYVEVNAQGVPQNIKVLRSLAPELDTKAVLAVQEWRFKPARKDGAPVTVSAKVDVQFRLPRYPLLPSVSPRPKDVPAVETDEGAGEIGWWDLIFR